MLSQCFTSHIHIISTGNCNTGSLRELKAVGDKWWIKQSIHCSVSSIPWHEIIFPCTWFLYNCLFPLQSQALEVEDFCC